MNHDLFYVYDINIRNRICLKFVVNIVELSMTFKWTKRGHLLKLGLLIGIEFCNFRVADNKYQDSLWAGDSNMNLKPMGWCDAESDVKYTIWGNTKFNNWDSISSQTDGC
jgi:hypothetical protein